MARRSTLAAGVLAILLGGSGCVCCGNKGYGLARDAGPDCDLPTSQRNHVYVFAVGGVNPIQSADLDELREQLNRHGFAKVATGPNVYSIWMANEMRRIHEDDPNAVFVLLGVDSGSPTAVRLAEKAASDGLPVGGVVLVDPQGIAKLPKAGLPTLTLASPDGGEIANLLNQIAATTPPRMIEPATQWHYQHAPDPRPNVDPGQTPEWAFLFDHPGGSIRPINEVDRVIVAQPQATKPGVQARVGQ